MNFFVFFYVMPSERCLNKAKVIESSHHEHNEQCHRFGSHRLQLNHFFPFLSAIDFIVYAKRMQHSQRLNKINFYLFNPHLLLFHSPIGGMNDTEM